MQRKGFFNWACRSLAGHLVLFVLFGSTSLFATLAEANYEQGTLTLEWGLFIALACIAAGALIGAFFWFAVTEHLLKKQK